MGTRRRQTALCPFLPLNICAWSTSDACPSLCVVGAAIPNASHTCPPVCSPCPISQRREGPLGPKPENQERRGPARSINFLISASYHLCPEQGAEWDRLSVLACVPPSVLARSDQDSGPERGCYSFGSSGSVPGVRWACAPGTS